MSKRPAIVILPIVIVPKRLKVGPKTPPMSPRKDPPSTPPRRPKAVRTLSRRLLGRVHEQCNLGTPVKIWPKGFWTARKNLYEESEEMRPATPVKVCPSSPQDIFK